MQWKYHNIIPYHGFILPKREREPSNQGANSSLDFIGINQDSGKVRLSGRDRKVHRSEHRPELIGHFSYLLRDNQKGGVVQMGVIVVFLIILNIGYSTTVNASATPVTTTYIGVKYDYITFRMNLTFKNEEVEGQYVYDGSRDTINLIGSLDGEELVLSEWIDGEEAGYFKGILTRDTFQGIWYTDAIVRDWPVEFYKENNKEKSPSFKPTFYTFQSKFSLTGEWNIYTDHKKELSGTYRDGDGNIHTIRLLESNPKTQEFYIALVNEFYNAVMKVTLDLMNYKISNEVFNFDMQNVKESVYGKMGVYNSNVGFQYLLEIPEIDIHSSSFTFFRDTSCNLALSIQYQPETRGSLMRFSNISTYYVTRRYISGVYNIEAFDNSRSCKSSYVLNWDLNRRKALDLTEGLINAEVWESDAMAFVKDFLSRNKPRQISNEIWSIVRPEDFDMMVISSKDLLLVRPRDDLFGQLTIKLPESLIKKHYNSKSFVYKHVVK